jgi:hypothetical protein
MGCAASPLDPIEFLAAGAFFDPIRPSRRLLEVSKPRERDETRLLHYPPLAQLHGRSILYGRTKPRCPS